MLGESIERERARGIAQVQEDRDLITALDLILQRWPPNERASLLKRFGYETEDQARQTVSHGKTVVDRRLSYYRSEEFEFAVAFVWAMEMWKTSAELAKWDGNSPRAQVADEQRNAQLVAEKVIEQLHQPNVELDTIARNLISRCARHSPDYRSVLWYGTDYTFAPNQAACVKILWDAFLNRTPEVSGEYLITEADIQNSTQRIDIVFRGNPAWGTMIVKGSRKGTYRLKAPEAKTAPTKSKARAKRRT